LENNFSSISSDKSIRNIMNNETRGRGKDKFDLTFPFSSFSTSPLLSHKISNSVERKDENEKEEKKGREKDGKKGKGGGKRGREEMKGKSTYNRNTVLTNLSSSPFENFNSKHSVRSTYGDISVRAPLGKNILSSEHSSIEKIKISREEKKLKKAEQDFFENEKLKKITNEEKGFLKISGEEKDGETKEKEEHEDGKEEIVESDEEEKNERAKDDDSENFKFIDSNNLKSVKRENAENSKLRKNYFADSHTSSIIISNLSSTENYLSKEEEVEIEEELMRLLLSSPPLINNKNEVINDDIDNNNNENNNNNNYEHDNDCINYTNKYQKQKQEKMQKQKPKYNMKISKNNFSRSQEANRTGLTEISFRNRSSLPSLNLAITPSLSSSLPLPLPLSHSTTASSKTSYFENKRESVFSATDFKKTRK
jgi:hypothetical protein